MKSMFSNYEFSLITEKTKSNMYLKDIYKDRLYIELIVLGCDNEEISELVNVSAQSVRNRKMLLKQHVNANCNIEIWLKTEVEATLSAFTNL